VKLGYALLLGRRCAIAAISAAGVSIMAAPASAAALPPGCSQSGQIVSCTQTFTSGSNPFTVPSGVSSLGVKAVGGQGGGAGGAFGAVVTGELPVTPGATIYAVVAANGDGGGGNGGGPAGGGFLSSVFPPASSNGGGGGASDVRSSADELSSRVLVAAGGGGGGGDASNTGLTPAPGSPGGGSGTSEDASATAGGPGGAANETLPQCNNPFGPPIPRRVGQRGGARRRGRGRRWRHWSGA
jgi:Glycine rich protein